MAGSAYYFLPPHTCCGQREGKRTTNLGVEVCICVCVQIVCVSERVVTTVCVLRRANG